MNVDNGNSTGLTQVEGSEPSLHPLDLACLRRSGLSDRMIQLMGCRTMSREEINQRLGVRCDSDGYTIPYEGLTDQTGQTYVRVRLRNPSPKGPRYLGGKGDDPELYIPRGFYDLPKSDLLIVTEGEKKAAKTVQEGIPAVGLQGVSSWSDPDARAVEKHADCGVSEDTPPHGALLSLAKAYLRVLVVGDSDLLEKPQARAWLEMLVRSLRENGIWSP